ncbi:MAG: serine/threonine protein kinase [Kiritimatiellaeota bacterium]|nr:serine/threonine protein kinase [Kiritimatiellota bacterium]
MSQSRENPSDPASSSGPLDAAAATPDPITQPLITPPASGTEAWDSPLDDDYAIPLQGGEMLGPYRITGFIARGGTALVYKATDAAHRPLALKVMEENPALTAVHLARFRREAEALQRLGEHPGIVRIYGTGRQGRTHYIAMELVTGPGSLADLLSDGPLERRRALITAVAVAEALEFAHAHNIVHRDLKPANILISETGRPLLTDFGLARMESAYGLTLSQATLGTPRYMSPEQTLSGKVGASADIYSFGVILYQMLTGRLPYEIPDDAATGAVFDIIRKVPPTHPRKLRREIPWRLEAVVLALLEKDPRDRYPTISRALRDLNACIEGRNVTVHRPNVFERTDRLVRAHPVTAIVTVVVVAAFVIGALYARHRIFEEKLAALVPVLQAQGQAREIERLKRTGAGETDETSDVGLAELQRGRKLVAEGRARDAAGVFAAVAANAATSGAPGLRQAAVRERARALMADGRFTEAAALFGDLAGSLPSAPGRQMARFEKGVALQLAGQTRDAAREWRHVLERGDAAPGLSFLARTALGDLPADYAAGQAQTQPSVIRAMALWLAATHTRDAQVRDNRLRRAAEAARTALPWLPCHLKRTGELKPEQPAP